MTDKSKRNLVVSHHGADSFQNEMKVFPISARWSFSIEGIAFCFVLLRHVNDPCFSFSIGRLVLNHLDVITVVDA